MCPSSLDFDLNWIFLDASKTWLAVRIRVLVNISVSRGQTRTWEYNLHIHSCINCPKRRSFIICCPFTCLVNSLVSTMKMSAASLLINFILFCISLHTFSDKRITVISFRVIATWVQCLQEGMIALDICWKGRNLWNILLSYAVKVTRDSNSPQNIDATSLCL